jgi:hypothetical protein
MKQRGPIPRGEYRNKSMVVSTRLREDTKQAIVRKAEESGRSFAQEVEYRLRRSLDDDRHVVDRFGGQRNYAVLQLISSIMGTVKNPFMPGADWLDDPYRFNQFVQIVNLVLEELRPPGDRGLQTTDEGTRIAGELQAGAEAFHAVSALQHASAELPLDPSNPFPRIKSDLGPVADRFGHQPGRGTAMGNADDIQRAAEELRRQEKEHKK